jgi:phage gp36-like protein
VPTRVGQPYAELSDLYMVISPAALTHPTTGAAAQTAQLLRASELVDDALCDRWVLPLTDWGTDVIQAVCDIAAYRLVCLRGFNPEADGEYAKNFKAAKDWLAAIKNGEETPNVTDSSPAAQAGVTTVNAQPTAESPAPVRWNGQQTRGTSRR